jgi:hypothetical protein
MMLFRMDVRNGSRSEVRLRVESECNQVQTGVMQEFLVCYDYGTGGLWWWITAPSADAIRASLQDVHVFNQPPDWWTEADDTRTRHLTLTDESDKALNMIRR